MTLRNIGVWTLAIALLVGLPTVAMAAEFRAGDDRVSITDSVNENLYTAGGSVSVDSEVAGDLFIGGGEVRVGGDVRDDLFVGGGNIDVEGAVHGDVRVGGGQIRIAGDVTGDLLVFGGQVEISEGARVGGDVNVFSGQLIIAGETGSIQAGVGELVIENTATVNGDLTYTSEAEAVIPEGATVTGSITYNTPPVHPEVSRAGIFSAFLAGGAIWLLVSVLMAMVLGYGLPGKTQALMMAWRGNFGMNLLWGLVFLIVTPVLAVILLVSTVGFPLGLITFGVYGLMLYVAKLVAALSVGAWIQSMWDKKSNGTIPVWSAAVIGVIGLALVAIVPALGALAVFIAFLASLGAVVQYDWELFKKLRSDKHL